MKKAAFILAVIMTFGVLLCACSDSDSAGSDTQQSAEQKSGVTLSEVWSDIKNEVKFDDFSEFNAKKMKNYYGITEDMMDEFAGGRNTSGVNQEEIVLVKAKDEGSAADIKEKLDKRFDSKLDQNKNYNAEQAKMIEGCKVEQNGLYVTMIVSDNAERITEIFKNKIK